MKRLLSISILLCLAAGTYAQVQDNGTSFSLQQAIEYAYEHQTTMLNAKLDEQIAIAQINEIKGRGIPQISASLDVKDFLKLPVTVVPGEFFGGKEGELIPFAFGTQWNATAGINASQMIFDPTYFIGLQANRSIRELSQENTTRTRIETATAVSKAYYNVLVNKARMQLVTANVDRLKKLHDDTKALYENGFVEKIDYDRAALIYNNAVTEKENTSRLMLLSTYLLKYQMGMGVNTTLILSDSLDASQVKGLTVSAENPDPTKRIEYSLLQTQKRLHYLDMKRYNVSYIPSITAYGNLSQSSFSYNFDMFGSKGKWYSSGLIGATLSWNIFDGLQNRARSRQAKFEMQKTDNDIDNFENGINLQVSTARTALQNALMSFTSQEQNLKLANEVSSVTKIKYEQGVGSNLEVVTAETALREAQTNYYNALYEALVAKIDLDKALGNIK